MSRLFPGAYCSKQLADLGARVIKVEEPHVGDFYRAQPLGKIFGEEIFQAFNQGKESLSLNIKSEEGRAILWQLIGRADILLESFRPGVLGRLGFTYEKIKAVNPRLIFCSITGYGQTGPKAQEAGHDLNYMSMAGLLHVADGDPQIPPFQMADLAGGGLFGAVALLAALFERESSGKGSRIDLALAEGALSLAAPYLNKGVSRQKSCRNAHHLLSGGAASYQLYQAKDEQWLALAALEGKFWRGFQRLCGSRLGGDTGMDPTVFSTGLRRRIARLMRRRTRAQWLRQARRTDICLTPVHTHRSVFREPQFLHRRVFSRQRIRGQRARWGVKSPYVFDKRRHYAFRRAPKMGQHNGEILRELGYHPNRIKRMRKDGVI